MEINKAKAWAIALRSEYFKQHTKFDLYSAMTNSYSALGVLDAINYEMGLSREDMKGWIWKYGEIGLRGPSGVITGSESFQSLNEDGFTFDEIADIVEIEYVLGL